MRRRRRGADGTAGFQTGEEHDLRSLKKMLLGSVAAMAIVAGVAVSPASASGARRHEWPSTGLQHAGRERAVPRVAGRACAPRGVRGRGDAFPAGHHGELDAGRSAQLARLRACRWIRSRSRSSAAARSATWISDKPGIAAHQGHRARRGRREHLREAVPRRLDGTAQAGRPWAAATSMPADFCNDQGTRRRSRPSTSGCTGRSRTAPTTRGDPRHRIQITVKGNLPLEADFSKWGLGDHLMLPDDWGSWAAAVARTTWRQRSAQGDVQLGHPRRLADDRGSRQDLGKQCPDPRYSEKYDAFDAVDNCTGAEPAGGFSTVFGTALARRPHDRPVRSALLLRHDALRRQGRRR